MISIRKAKKEDLKSISEIFRKEANKKPFSQRWTQKTALDNTKESFKEEKFHVAVDNKKIIGFILSTIIPKGEAFVSELWVDSKYQRKGIGKDLTTYVEDIYRKKGIKSIELSTNKKAPAVKFYKKLGYSVKHETLRMSKRLR